MSTAEAEQVFFNTPVLLLPDVTARRYWKYCHTQTTYVSYLRFIDPLIEPPPSSRDPLTEVVQEFCDRLVLRAV